MVRFPPSFTHILCRRYQNSISTLWILLYNKTVITATQIYPLVPVWYCLVSYKCTYLDGFCRQSRNQILGVDLMSGKRGLLDGCCSSNLLPFLFTVIFFDVTSQTFQQKPVHFSRLLPPTTSSWTQWSSRGSERKQNKMLYKKENTVLRHLLIRPIEPRLPILYFTAHLTTPIYRLSRTCHNNVESGHGYYKSLFRYCRIMRKYARSLLKLKERRSSLNCMLTVHGCSRRLYT